MESVRVSAQEMSRNTLRPLPKARLPRRSEERLAWAMLAPVLLVLLILGVYPALSSIWFSFQQGGFFGIGMTNAGISNYLRLVHDPQFWNAFRFSLLFSLITVPGQLIFGTALALFANRQFPGRWLVRAAILCPWAIPTVTSSVIWAYIFNDRYGLVNSLLAHLGLMDPAHPINWLGSAPLATLLIYALAIWKANAVVALLVLTTLQAIPKDLYEMARVDGARAWQSFWHILLPLLRPTLIIALILRTIESWQTFDLISAFTNGAPGNSTQNLGLYIYVQFQQFGDFAYGSTIAVIVMVIALVFISLYVSALSRAGTR